MSRLRRSNQKESERSGEKSVDRRGVSREMEERIDNADKKRRERKGIKLKREF